MLRWKDWMMNHIRRREVITLLGSVAAAWPLAARAQQPAMPVVGFLGAPSPESYLQYTAAIRRGLQEAGFVEGQNLTIDYRWAEGRYDRLPVLAADLVNRRVSLIVPIGGAPAVLAAKAATSTIPIVFNMAADPVELGVVASLNRPGGNVTGVAMMGVELEAKRFERLRELVPTAALIAMLVNPDNAPFEMQSRAVQEAARGVGQPFLILHARNEDEIDTAFAAMAEQRAGALMVGADTYFTSQTALLVALSARYRIPTIYAWREHVVQGGLMSYATNLTDAYRQTGAYAGRVLKGTKPADLPVTQPTRFEMAINLKTAKALGLTIPEILLATADEVIQ
jgi:putative ABC transport system substrate-binding protein